MKAFFNTKLILINSIISVLIIILLQLDYFLTKKFMLEFILDFGLSLLLILNIVRQAIPKLYSMKLLSYLVNGMILLAGLYSIGFLLLLFWGYGFTGRETPFIWTLAFILNLLLMIAVLFEARPLLEKM